MATPVGFEGAQGLLSGEHIEDCGDLPVFIAPNGLISCWRLSEEELKMIQETGVVWVMVLSHMPPPMLIQVQPLVHIGDRPSKPEPILTRATKERNDG